MTMLVETTTTQVEETSCPTPAAVARALVVVAGGPVLLGVLELVGPLSAVRRWPQRMPTARTRRAAAILTAAGVVAPVLDHGIVRPRLRRWGATAGERSRRLAGDRDRSPLFTTTRAATPPPPGRRRPGRR